MEHKGRNKTLCPKHTVCRNTQGSYTCRCRKHYSPKGKRRGGLAASAEKNVKGGGGVQAAPAKKTVQDDGGPAAPAGRSHYPPGKDVGPAGVRGASRGRGRESPADRGATHAGKDTGPVGEGAGPWGRGGPAGGGKTPAWATRERPTGKSDTVKVKKINKSQRWSRMTRETRNTTMYGGVNEQVRRMIDAGKKLNLFLRSI